MPLELVRAQSAAAAAALLASDKGARFLAGGTLVMRAANYDDGSITRLIFTDGLDRIDRRGNRVEIGAAVTMAAVSAHPDLHFLAPVARSIGGPAVRNMATVGGNLFAPAPYGDFAVALLALGASVAVATAAGVSIVDMEAFLAERGRGGRIVQSVAFDLPSDGAFRFTKVERRRPHGAAVLTIAALLPVAAGRLAGPRIAYGAMALTPIRARAVEAALEGKSLECRAIDAAIAAATEGCAPASDAFASDWYRLNVLPVHLKRILSGRS